MPKNLYIIDGHAHIYAAYFAPMRQRLTSPSGEPTKAIYIFTTAVLGLIKNQKPDMLVVAMDSKTPTFRTRMYPEYKAHRPPMPDDMPVQINRIEQIMSAMNVPILRVNGFEADDIIGTLARKAAATGIDVYICSKDKDILQLIDDHIFAYDMKTGDKTDVASIRAEMKIAPGQFIDVLALQGDASDNVPGVADVGPKTALEWIQKYGSLDNLLSHADEIAGKRGDSLRKSKDVVYLSRRLVTIDCDVSVDIDYDAFTVKTFDQGRLTQIFNELGFIRLLGQLGLSSSEQPAQTQQPQPSAISVGKTGSAATVKHDYQLIDTFEKFEFFLAELQKQKVFAIDTETTSLAPMRADLVGISFSWQPKSGFYIPVRAPVGARHLSPAKIREKLAPILADPTVKKIGQNIKYDMLVLRNAGLPLGGVYFDTMVASYCLDPQRNSHSLDNMAFDFLNYQSIPISVLIGKGKNQITFDMVDTAAACEYSAEDADMTWQLYQYLAGQLERQPQIKKLFYDVEMPLVSVLAEMEYNGVSLNTEILADMSEDITASIGRLVDEIYQTAGVPFNIDSPKQLAEVLFERLGLKSIRSGKTGLSTDAAVLEELAEEHPVINLILEYRTLSKLKNTYVDKLGSLINRRTGRVHASFNQTVTVTGRLSSSDPNLQNIPIRTPLGGKIRSAFVPKNKTDCVLSADYSQIELRLLACFSKDKAMREAFAADMDIHRFVASQIFNVPIEKVTPEMRSRCKAVNFGIIYGQGALGLAHGTGLTPQEAKKFIDDYFARYSSIRDFMDGVVEQTKKTGFVETILHRRRRILNLDSGNPGKRAQARRLAVNTVIQGSAADLIKVAMVNIHRKIESENLPVKMVLQVHDELVFELPTTEADEHAKWIAYEMTSAIKLDVPLKVDVTFGPSWLADK
ncbi:MAG: DNA polymerase I [Sedimentisphaerales bacterium]|nr:DNA polymerase I [Sedimentisphaerales bacterium]